MEESTTGGKVCCAHTKNLVLIGVVGCIGVVCVLLLLADKIGLGLTPVFSKRTITVMGSATRQQKNELASFSAVVSSKNPDKASVVADVTQKSQKLGEDLKQFGVLEKDIKTQSLNIYREQIPYYNDGVQQYKDGDWTASITVEITLRDISRANDLTDLLAKSDTSNIYAPSFTVSEGELDTTELLKNAFTNAKAKAESLAGGMGLKTGKVLSVVEGSGASASPYPLKELGMGAGGGGLEPGSSVVSTTLTVTFELR